MVQIKAVQMDLGRQKETIEEIYNFFKLANDYKYNTVVLYLEDKVKTESYPYISDEDSYSPEEIKQIVKLASEFNLELIPVVNNFSHTDGFFENEEMRYISELRNGDEGFFGDIDNPVYFSACPLFSEAKSFFDNYYKEVASLFPSKYFLAGLDETFDIGSCELCKADVEEHGGIGHLFLNHVIRTNNVLKALGKQMLMFDDMFWLCPEVLPDVPKDIIMCTWCYDFVDRYPRSPYGVIMQKDVFAEYDKLGLKYIMVPWANFTHNVDSFTKYAKKYSPFGYLNTTWGMTSETLHFTYPLVAYAGMLWNGELEDEPFERMKKAVRETCGVSNPIEVAALSEAATKPYLMRANIYYCHDLIVRKNVNFDDEYKDVSYNYDVIKTIESDNEVVKQIKYRAKRAKLLYEQFLISQKVFDMRTGAEKTDLSKCVEKLCKIKEEMLGLFKEQEKVWNKYRAGVPKNYLERDKNDIISSIEKSIKIAEEARFEQNGYLDIVFLMPDKNIDNLIDLKIQYEDGKETVFENGYYKPLWTACYNITDKGPYFFTASLAIEADKKIKSCSVSVKGIGEAHIEHIYAFAKGVTYSPQIVKAIHGNVKNPDNLLKYDTRWCSVGQDDTIKFMNDLKLRKEKSTIEVCF